MAAKVKKGDKVIVLTGRDKGRSGEVIEVRPAAGRALVRGISMVKRHQKQTAQQEGGIISKESSVHLSNLALADPKDGKATRAGDVWAEEVERDLVVVFPDDRVGRRLHVGVRGAITLAYHGSHRLADHRRCDADWQACAEKTHNICVDQKLDDLTHRYVTQEQP